MSDLKPISIYLHWPYCETKCPYCDFNSHIKNNENEENWDECYKSINFHSYISSVNNEGIKILG